jgi:hypothetical protein
LIGYDTDVNTYKEGTLRLSLVDSETKYCVERHGLQQYFKSQNESKAIAKLWMIWNTPKIANPNDFFFEIIDSLNRNTKLIINTKINIMKLIS